MSTDPTKLKVAKELSRQDILFGVARVPGTERLFFGSSDAKLFHVDMGAEKPEPQEVTTHGSYVTGVTLAGKYVISGGYDRRLVWCDAESRAVVRTVDAHQRWLRNLVTSPDGQTVASVADDMVCRLWDAETGQMKHELRGHESTTPNGFPSMLYACTISADGKYVATGDKTGHIVVWDLASGEKVATVEAPGMYTWDPTQRRHSIGGIRSLAFSPDGKLLAVGGMGKVGNVDHPEAPARLEVFDWREGKRTHEFPGEAKLKGLIEHLAFHPEGDWLVGAGGGYQGVVLFYDLKNNKVIHQDAAPMRVHAMALSENGERIYAVGHHKILVWEVKA